ncbi:hypothetical protein ONZ45_g3206 [Pleurotus djamor]|nr:hypothetical protein ONZ45_g3206 [Pleurotus djamor]
MSKCPVDHGSSSSPPPPPTENSGAACPVDHSSSTSPWSRFMSPSSSSSAHPASLSADREISTIPKGSEEGNWVYPSEAQFFSAMMRKNHNPQAADMKTIVPIHNAVNERAWAEIRKWEDGRGGDKCGGVKLVNFKGKPTQRSLKAQWNTLLGYSPPFDRHDWVVDRCGVRMRYIIDFYTGHTGGPSSNNLSFYLDARPAMDNWEGVKMRIEHLWSNLFSNGSS